MKKLSDYLLSDVVKNTTFNTLKTKPNSLENKIPDATTLTHISQYNTDKQNLEKKIGYVDKKIRNTRCLVTTTVLNTKINEVENKIHNHDKYIATPEFNELTAESFAAILKQANLVERTDFDNKLTSYNRRNIPNKTKYLQFQKKLNSLMIIIFSLAGCILQVMMDLKTRLFIN